MWKRWVTASGTTSCIEWSLPTRFSGSFQTILCWVAGISTKVGISSIFLYWRMTVPASVSRIHPRTSLAQIQPPSPAMIFFTLTESFSSPVNDGKSHLRAWNVPSKTQCWKYSLPCTADMKSSI